MPCGNGRDTDWDIIGRESEQTSGGYLITRRFDEPTKETPQMATVTQEPVGAVSHEPNGWHDIDWRAVHENVRRLQAPRVRPSAAHSPA